MADAFLLFAFLYFASGSGSPAERAEPSQDALGMADAATVQGPADPAEATPSYGVLKAGIEELIAARPSQTGVAVLDAEGELVVGHREDRPFVLASVAKLYVLAAYLDQQNQAGGSPGGEDVALLQAMIGHSDNDSASVLWRAIGEEEGLASFLESRDLEPVTTTEQGAWGTLNASASQVAELLWRLMDGRLLDPGSTQLALGLLADVDEEQAWGVTAGTGPFSEVFLKNGWYPESEGWRVNSAGVVEQAGQRYVVVVLVYPASGMAEGVSLIEDIATRVNRFMAGEETQGGPSPAFR